MIGAVPETDPGFLQVLLGYQTDSLVTDHGLLYSRNGFLAADIES